MRTTVAGPRLRNGAERPESEGGGQPSTLRRARRAPLPQWHLALASAVSGAPCRSRRKAGKGGGSSSSPSPRRLLHFAAALLPVSVSSRPLVNVGVPARGAPCGPGCCR